MPLLNSLNPPTTLDIGIGVNLLNAETLGTGNRSIIVAIPARPTGAMGSVSVQFSYAIAPSSVSYSVQISNDGVNWQTAATTTRTSGERVEIINTSFKFLSILENTTPNQNATATALYL